MTPTHASDRARRPVSIALRWLTAAGLVVAGGIAIAWGLRWIGADHDEAREFKQEHHPTAVALGAVLLAAAPIFYVLHRDFADAAFRASKQFAIAVDGLSARARRLDLVLASVLGLFLEVALIRWHGTEFRACAYFKNITLLACFLGLGLGFARARRDALSFPIMLAALAFQVLMMDVLSLAEADRAIRNPVAGEIFWGLAGVTRLAHHVLFYGFFAALFVSTIVIFVPIGQLTGRLMDPAAPLASYTLNIVGSILGVGLFALVSLLWLSPPIWFGIAALVGLWLVRHHCGALVVSGCAATAMVAWLGHEPRTDVRNIYSPYQRLELRIDQAALPDGTLIPRGFLVAANKTYYMHALDLSDASVAKWGDRLADVREKALLYGLPYRLAQQPRRVLIVGSGAGNDVAAAVRNGVQEIDAVEIDPAILRIGRLYHPESPYQARGVRAFVADARAFMTRAPGGSYDLVVFGLLDSHTLLSGMSSIRLDNFVYTREALSEVRRLLRPGGVLCLTFAVGPQGIYTARMFKMLTEVFGQPPRTFGYAGENQNTVFVSGLAGNPAASQPVGDVPETTPLVAASARKLDPPASEDDWPFPFLPGRAWHQFPRPYLYLIVLLAAISAAVVLVGTERRTTIDGHFFFLGGAFLLIETKGLTELALVYGATWIVASVVIAAILSLILLANWTVHVLRPRSLRAAYLALLAALLVGYLIPVHTLLERGWLPAAVGAPLLLCLPLYFAGIIFATSIRTCTSPASALASNLLGAILGGLCEYASMVTGLRALYLLGMALYALSWLCLAAQQRAMPSRSAAASARPLP